MAVLTPEDFDNLKIDIEDAGKCPNIDAIINPRYGIPFMSFPMVSRLGQEGFTAAIQKIENMGGYISAASLTELNTRTPTFNYQLARVQDTGDEYFWDPTATPSPAWKPTGKNWLNAAKDYVNANHFFKPVIINSAVDFRTLKTPGYYAFVSGQAWDASTNKPNGISNQWAFLEVFPISDVVVGQYVWCLNSQKKAFTFCNAVNVWAPWSIYSDDSALTNIIKSAINLDRDATFDARVVNNITPVFENLSKNLFDKNAPLLMNRRINQFGALEEHTNSVTTSYINVSGLSSIVISGLTASTAAYRAYIFLDKDKQKIGNVASVALNATHAIVNTIPSNAVYFQICLKDGIDTWALNTSTVQIESGTAATAYTAYVKGKLKSIYGSDFSNIVDPVQVYTIADPVFENLSKNIFDKSAPLLANSRITAAGVLEQYANSVTTRPIYIKGLTSLTVSGLTASTAAYRAYIFLDKDKQKIGNVASVALNATRAIVNTIPPNAVYFQICLKDGYDTWSLNLDTIQIESGTAATAYTAYVRGNLKALFGAEIAGSGGSGGGIVSKAFGASYLLVGDSITQCSRVDEGIFDDIDLPFPNWPTYAKPILKPSKMRNYAKSGASFRNKNLEPLQFLRNQVELAITNGETPDVIVVACGTNDGISSLGTYETAMSKATLESLDQTICLEAARWVFWKLRMQYPDAVCFFANPLQRVSNTVEELAPMVDGLSKMALRYGFTLIDQNKECGIIRDIEIPDRKFLDAEGLHPNTAGRILQANYIVSKIIARMTY